MQSAVEQHIRNSKSSDLGKVEQDRGEAMKKDKEIERKC